MEQRDSLEHSSSENLAPHSALNGSGYNGGSELPANGQTTLAPQPALPMNESSPVVDSVLHSDVGLLGEYSHEWHELKVADWH